jgi:YesN/AraC family two-component response regulator
MDIYDNVYRITSGTIVFIPANVLHKTTYLNQNTHERIYIEFTLDYITNIIDAIGMEQLELRLYKNFFVVAPEDRSSTDILFDHIMEEKQNSDSYSKCMIQTYLQQLILKLLRKSNSISVLSLSSDVRILDESMQNALTYISHHYNQQITLDDVASFLNLNSSYFSKKFKFINGFSFKEFLNRVRISNAERLLLETDKSVTDIAFLCGYENSNYFGDAFKHLNGVSPSVFRKIHGNI